MAFTVCFALFGSMLLALTLIPVLATYLFPERAQSWENPVLTWLSAKYERALRATIGHPGRVVATAAVVVVASFCALHRARIRIPAAARRRRRLDSARGLPGRHLADEIGGARQRDSSPRQANSRSPRGRLADRTQRRWDRSVWAESQRAVRSAEAVRRVGSRQGQSRPGRGAVRAIEDRHSWAASSASLSRSSTT